MLTGYPVMAAKVYEVFGFRLMILGFLLVEGAQSDYHDQSFGKAQRTFPRQSHAG